MGNCQAAEAATVVIEHPGGRVERFYWSLSACHVMAANPGHYVAAVIVTAATPPPPPAAAAAHPVKHLKLLRPDDTLLIGRVYRLVTFEEVLREFASRRRVKLSRLTVKQKGNDDAPRRQMTCSTGSNDGRCEHPARMTEQATATATMHARAAAPTCPTSEEPSAEPEGEVAAVAIGGRRQAHQWRPALESIAESAGS